MESRQTTPKCKIASCIHVTSEINHYRIEDNAMYNMQQQSLQPKILELIDAATKFIQRNASKYNHKKLDITCNHSKKISIVQKTSTCIKKSRYRDKYNKMFYLLNLQIVRHTVWTLVNNDNFTQRCKVKARQPSIVYTT